jgi:hypothetical protein
MSNDEPGTFLLVVGVVFLIVDFGLFCCSVIGNAIVIYVISRDKKLKSKSNYHILSVAAGDFIIALFGIPLGVTAVSVEAAITQKQILAILIPSLD